MPIRPTRPPSLKKRLLFTLAACAILALVARSTIGDRGLIEIWRKHNAHQQLATEVQALREENIALNQEIQALRSDALAIERIAREQLGYSRPGEVTFIFQERSDSRNLLAP